MIIDHPLSNKNTLPKEARLNETSSVDISRSANKDLPQLSDLCATTNSSGEMMTAMC